MIEFDTEISDVIQRTHNVKSFRFKIKEGTDFKAGQFFFVTIKINGLERTKHFSFSNSPTEKGYIEFTKKITESEFSKALDKLKIDDWARLKMPYGSFMLEEEYKKIAFLSGGIGITPIRSITKYVIDKKLDTDMVLLYGNRSTTDIAFKEDFEVMQKQYSKLKVIHVLSEAEAEWSGRRGYIGVGIIKDGISDYAERKFYICGPPLMVDSMQRIILEGLNIPKENIITENFSGY